MRRPALRPGFAATVRLIVNAGLAGQWIADCAFAHGGPGGFHSLVIRIAGACEFETITIRPIRDTTIDMAAAAEIQAWLNSVGEKILGAAEAAADIVGGTATVAAAVVLTLAGIQQKAGHDDEAGNES